MLSWTKSLLRDVHLCPVVPAAEKVTALVVKSKSADGQTMAALFPPNSKRLLPSLLATIGANAFPISQLPVADSKDTFSSLASDSAFSFPPLRIIMRALCSPAISSHISLIKSAQPSVCGLGFQIMELPHTAPKQKFQPKTATGQN